MTSQIWGGDTTTPSDKERAAAMDAMIIDLRRANTPWVEIGRQVALQFRKEGEDPNKPYTKQYMQERWRAIVTAIPGRKLEAHRAELNERLEGLLEQVEVIARTKHVAHSNGRVVTLDGEPLLDDGPKLAALAEARKLITEIRQLNGLTVPVKQELDLGGTVNYTINGVDPMKDLT